MVQSVFGFQTPIKHIQSDSNGKESVGKCDNKMCRDDSFEIGDGVLIRIIVNIFLGLLSVKFGRFLC